MPLDQATRATPRSKRPAADLAVFPRVEKKPRGGGAAGEVSADRGRRSGSEGVAGQVGIGGGGSSRIGAVTVSGWHRTCCLWETAATDCVSKCLEMN